MKIRPAELQDAGAATRVVRQSIAKLCRADHCDDRATLDMWLSNKTTDNMRQWIESQHMLVACDDANILGVAAMSRTGTILLNYVAPNARFQGVSKALMAGLEATAINLGIKQLALESTLTARSFYLSLGYVADGPSQPSFGLLIAHPMHKVIRQPASM